MKLLSNLRIGQRLALGFGAITLVALAASALSWIEFEAVDNQLHCIVEVN
jgi:hypothetical protein